MDDFGSSINYAEPESCTNAVENMNNYVIGQLTLYVNHSSTQTTNISSLPQNECRFNDESNIEKNSTSLPNSQNRFSSFQLANYYGISLLYLFNKTNYCLEININIREHDSFITNKNYSVYLSNLELPNIIFAATLDDYINTTLLLTKMNNHEQLAKFNKTIRRKNVFDILVFDVKLEMIVLRIENGLPYVQLNLGERNLNAEIRAILPQPSVSTTTTILQKLDDEQVNFNSNKPEMNIFETHSVQLTRVDADSECFHVVSMRDNLPTIMSALNDWDVEKQPLIIEPKPNMLICPQYQDTTEEKRLRKSPEKDESSISHQCTSHPSENFHAEVKFMDERISYTTIGSDGISSCTFLLVIGRIDDNEFAFLSHYPEPYEPPFTPITVLVDLIDKLSERMTEAIGKCPPPNMTKKKQNR
ncbi:unnamed protein product [Rotaria socialis]|uniref:Uncharacterized protein n=1 Tax=Rotaria socialis TaxID=392032 RepID=A0A817ULN8_9BILA|nr:unnamed protein product [Rotaria socialis]